MIRTMWKLLAEAFWDWMEDRASRLGAALAYYTLFSIAPLTVLVLAGLEFLFGRTAARERILQQISGLAGQQAAAAISQLMETAKHFQGGVTASIIGVITAIIGATAVFVQLQDALDTVWEVRRAGKSSILWTILERWYALVMVAVIGMLLLASLLLSAVLAGLNKYAEQFVPFSGEFERIVHLALIYLLTAVLFAVMFKVLPNVKVPWRCVWMGALLTAALFSLGKWAIGLYLGRSAVVSAYGAAGSVVVMLIWSYYSSQILLYGAEFCQVYARHLGLHLSPKKGYEPVQVMAVPQRPVSEGLGKQPTT